MILLCIAHNQIDTGDGWNEGNEDVTEIARRLRKPCAITQCPTCVSQSGRINRIKTLLISGSQKVSHG